MCNLLRARRMFTQTVYKRRVNALLALGRANIMYSFTAFIHEEEDGVHY